MKVIYNYIPALLCTYFYVSVCVHTHFSGSVGERFPLKLVILRDNILNTTA